MSPMKFLSDQEAEAVLQALKDRRSMRSILQGIKGPKLASRPLFLRYCASHPEYSHQTTALIEVNNKAAFRRQSDLKRNKTHCKRGHPLTNNVYIDRYHYRKCKTCSAETSRNPKPATEDQIQRVTAALNAGQTLNQICAGKLDGKRISNRILGGNKLKLYRAQNPDFDRFVAIIAPGNLERSRLRRRNPRLFQANVQRAETNDYHRIAQLVPTNLPPDMRDDIVQSIFLALLEGALRRDQVKERVRQFVTAHNGEAKRNGVGKFGMVSLDAPIFSDGSTTLGDTITRGIWD